MNKILKTLTVAIAATASTLTVQAQGIYFQGQLGYGFPAGGQVIESNTTDKTAEVKNYSLGSGANIGVAGGYMFSDNAGIELGIGYLMGGTVTTTDVDGTSTTTVDQKGSMLRIIPSFVVSVPMDAMNLYGRMGLALGMMPTVKKTSKMTDGSAEGTVESEQKFSGGMGLGISSAVGVGFGLSDNLNLFVELNSVSMSYRPDKSEITKFMVGGEDLLPDLTTSQKETEYVTEFNSETYTPSDSQPTQELRTNDLNFPFSSVGLNVGIRIMLGE